VSAAAHPGADRLLDLAAELLAPGDAEDTIRHLESCPPCEDRFREICRDAELAKLQRRPVRRLPVTRVAAVAASFLLLAALAWWVRAPRPEDAAAYWFPVDGETVSLRAGAPTADEQIYKDAVAAYRAHDPAKVVALLHDRAIPEVLDPLKIMLASALVKTGDARGAEDLLTTLRVETLPQPDRDRASWILYAALRDGGKKPEARALVETLASRAGEFEKAATSEAARLRKSDQ
jgi:hypothetical protein